MDRLVPLIHTLAHPKNAQKSELKVTLGYQASDAKQFFLCYAGHIDRTQSSSFIELFTALRTAWTNEFLIYKQCEECIKCNRYCHDKAV
jgi:hypothetical protein